MKVRSDILSIFLTTLIWVFAIPIGVFAYKQPAHIKINEKAIEKFLELAKNDPYLKYATLTDQKTRGICWDKVDGTSTWYYITQPKREKTMKTWIIDGGFSADEPELYMGLRHYFDPTAKNNPERRAWLTDQINRQPVLDNPQISAFDWAFIENHGNPYSFIRAKQYFSKALDDKSPNNEYYGQAWRAIGETMHLISDMTVPAHTRNDGHLQLDNYEIAVNPGDVEFNSKNEPAKTIQYKTTYRNDAVDIKQLMINVALWTNANFLSQDTIPLPGEENTTNGEKAYPSPKLDVKNRDGEYYYHLVDGNKLHLVKEINKNEGREYKIDVDVIEDQRSVLIPTAIRASAAVLDSFLPRFEVKINKVEKDPKVEGRYIIGGRIEHKPTKEWPGVVLTSLLISNGAYVKVNDKDIRLSMDDPFNYNKGKIFNNILYSIPAKEGDFIELRFDLGGYEIKSEKNRIPVSTPLKASEMLTRLQATNVFSARVYGVHIYELWTPEGTQQDTEDKLKIPFEHELYWPDKLIINWSGTTFSSRPSGNLPGVTVFSGTLSGEVSADGMEIKQLHYTDQYRSEGGRTLSIHRTEIILMGLPLIDNNELAFGCEGEKAANMIANANAIKVIEEKYIDGKLVQKKTYKSIAPNKPVTIGAWFKIEK